MNLKLKSGLVVSTAVIAALWGSVPASAGVSMTVWTVGDGGHGCSGRLGAAYGSFDHVSEITSVTDNCADGHSGVLRYKVGSGSTIYKVWATGGIGSTGSTGNAIAEGTAVHISACVGESGTGDIFGCSGWLTATA